MQALEQVFAETMPKEMGYDYLGMSFRKNLRKKAFRSPWCFIRHILCVSYPGRAV